MNCLCSCSNDVTLTQQWKLKDLADFTARELFAGLCHKCGNYVVILTETRKSDNKVFVQTYKDSEAKRLLMRELKRATQKNYIGSDFNLNGFIYGVNVEIKNKKGETTQIRQYSADFTGNKTISRKYYAR